jgi:methyl-accepting chemotaxis protein
VALTSRVPSPRHRATDAPTTSPLRGVSAPAVLTAAPEPPAAVADPTESRLDEAPVGDVYLRQARRLALVGELAGVALLVLVLASAVIIARYNASGIAVHVPAMAAWAFAGALIGVPLGHVRTSTHPLVAANRTLVSIVLLAMELGCLTGLLASAGGIAGPFWLVFLPLVLLTATAVSAEAGVLVGALASAGVYLASVVSHTLDADSVGRLVVVLPLLPAIGYVGSAVGAAARRAAADARADREALERDLAAIQGVLDEVALGDLSVVPAVRPDAHPAAATLAVALADTVVALRRLARGIQGGGDELAVAASGLLGNAEGLAAGATQQASSVTQVTSTVDELAATSSQIAETAQAVSRYAAETLRFADEGQVAVEASAGAMDAIAAKVEAITARAERLTEHTDRIARLIHVIDDIAVQTNMLAFNAAIEAARAGSGGKGFSVVAGEIRTLAERAREATQRVEDIVREIRVETERTREAGAAGTAEVQAGAELTRGVVAALERITAMVDDTTAAAREISVVTDQQRAASEQVVTAMGQVTQVSGSYADASRRAAEAAARLDTLAGELLASCGRFKVV